MPRDVEAARARLREVKANDPDVKSAVEDAWQRLLAITEFDPRPPHSSTGAAVTGLTEEEIAANEAAQEQLRVWAAEIEQECRQ